MDEEASELASQVWPVFLSSESDIPQAGTTFEIDESEFHRRFPAWGIRRAVDGKLVAFLNAVFIACDAEAPNLPEEGWQFAIEAGAKLQKPNALCLLMACVDTSRQRSGLSACLIARAKEAAQVAGIKFMIAPVRPAQMDARLSVAAHSKLKNENDEPADSWLRAHTRSGGEILNVCPHSTIVVASVSLWQRWTNLKFETSGSFVIPLGLAPLIIDLDRGIGTYTEPGIWVRYRL